MNQSEPNDKMNEPPSTLDEPWQEEQPNSKQTKGPPNLSLYDIVRLTFASLIGLFLLIPILSDIASKNEIDMTVISMTTIVVFYFLRRSSDSEQAIGRSPKMAWFISGDQEVDKFRALELSRFWPNRSAKPHFFYKSELY